MAQGWGCFPFRVIFCAKPVPRKGRIACRVHACGCEGGLSCSRHSASSAERLSADDTIRTPLPMTSISRLNASGAPAGMIRAGAPIDPQPVGIVLRAEDRERHRAARNGQNAVAGAVKDRKHTGRAAAGQPQDCGADRMRQRRASRPESRGG